MSVLVVVGLMNLVWMAALSLVFLLDKCWRHGRLASRVAGAGLLLLGIGVAVDPQLLPMIAGATDTATGGMPSGAGVSRHAP